MSKATERARERVEVTGYATDIADAALDYIEALEGPKWKGWKKETRNLHAEAKRKFEEAVGDA